MSMLFNIGLVNSCVLDRFEKQIFQFPVVCDFDITLAILALLNAIAKAFGQCFNLKHYLTTCFALILTEHTVEMPKCFI